MNFISASIKIVFSVTCNSGYFRPQLLTNKSTLYWFRYCLSSLGSLFKDKKKSLFPPSKRGVHRQVLIKNTSLRTPVLDKIKLDPKCGFRIGPVRAGVYLDLVAKKID